MKYLGEGYYYRVYALGKDRVIKYFQPYFFSFWKIFFFNRGDGRSILAALINAHRARVREKNGLYIIKDRLKNVPGFLFANPIFIRGLHYSQDRVTIVSDVLGKNTFQANKRIIDRYVAFQKKLWSYHLHDKTYKLQQNYGLDKSGALVCVDFGEFAYTKAEALASIQGKRWLHRSTYKNWADTALKNYYTARMEQLFKKETLDKHWKTSGDN